MNRTDKIVEQMLINKRIKMGASSSIGNTSNRDMPICTSRVAEESVDAPVENQTNSKFLFKGGEW
jgi:hypothetical protein